MGSAFIFYFSIAVIIVFMVYCKIRKEKVWNMIKKELVLLGAAMICFLILGLINNYVI
jgi:hypothetical protein